MKQIDEEKLYKIKAYIETYQLENGKSPSYREVMEACNLTSLSLVSRYLDLLQTRGQIKKNPLGGIEMSINLSSTTFAPLVGQVRCGAPLFEQVNYQSICSLPSEIFGKGELFMLSAIGDSMKDAGINEGDILVVRKSDYAENGQIVVALIDDEATVKRFKKTSNKIILHPENSKYQDILLDDVKILGVVQSCIHKF